MSLRSQRLHVVGQRSARAAQPLRQPVHLTHTPVDPIEARAEVERRARLLDMTEAAAYLRYKGRNAPNSAYCFLRKHGVKLARRGTVVLVRVGDIDRLLSRGASDFVERARSAMGAK